MINFKKALIILPLVLFLAACMTANEVKRTLAVANAVTADNLNTQQFTLDLMRLLGESGANSLVNIEAHEGRPITIDARSFRVNAPLDLQAIFNSAAFQRDWGAVFPPNTNGWDFFIATVSAVRDVAMKDTPWLAGALSTALRRTGVNLNGDNNSVATEGGSINNSDNSDQSDRSDNSDNSSNGLNVEPIDTTQTPLSVGAVESPSEPTTEPEGE